MASKAADVPTGMEAVAGNEDLLSEILVRLPPKPLLRFKSVSKTWLRLISCPQFRRRSSQRLCKDVSGLLVMGESGNVREFTPLHENAGRNPPLGRLDFVEGQVIAFGHCNGLLLCSTVLMLGREYYVFNYTTKEYATVSVEPALKFGEIEAKLYDVSLAFDPRKSLHYKLLFTYRSGTTFRLQMYSSDTGLMRQFDVPFTAQDDELESFGDGVFWNGAVNWFDDCQGGLYFNVDEERFGKLPMSPVPESSDPDLVYYGESNDHLHLILTYTGCRFIDIYEMEKGYSRWFLRFRVDPQSIFGSLPQSLSPLQLPVNFFEYGCFCVLGVFRKDDDDESFLVFTTPGIEMVFRHNFKDGSAAIISNAVEEHHHVWGSIPYIESLYCP